MNAKQKITLVAVDLAILVELCVGMYAAGHDPENFTPAFCKSFFSLFVPTLLGGITLIRLLRDKARTEPGAA
ncbi:hypothetical protein [Fundidesulfovibrio agrisoli]|uniref:hypothetical protein n=1 Tax=Fundidesulfovibrio agrisoli TaxID=2922717 RepID=UPI001FACBA8E|nr:hypothetical protein [Fundidesulfovibrio agrisoli]